MGLYVCVSMTRVFVMFRYLGRVKSVHLFDRSHFLAVDVGADVFSVIDCAKDAVTLSHCRLLGVL